MLRQSSWMFQQGRLSPHPPRFEHTLPTTIALRKRKGKIRTCTAVLAAVWLIRARAACCRPSYRVRIRKFSLIAHTERTSAGPRSTEAVGACAACCPRRTHGPLTNQWLRTRSLGAKPGIDVRMQDDVLPPGLKLPAPHAVGSPRRQYALHSRAPALTYRCIATKPP
jgi:hypothetical protein